MLFSDFFFSAMAETTSPSTTSNAYAARPKTSGTTAGPMIIPSIPITTHEVKIRWASADDHSLNRVLAYMRLNTPACEVNEWLMSIEVEKDFTVVPPLDRWGSLGVYDLSAEKSIILLIGERQLYQDIRGYTVRAMNGLLDLRTGRSLKSAGYESRFFLATGSGHWLPRLKIYRPRYKSCVKNSRRCACRWVSASCAYTSCATPSVQSSRRSESLVGLFPGLLQQVPADPLFDPVHGPGRPE